ncbi:hypothetical protein N0H69_18610 [Yersinia alsatica]|uniref:Tail fiber protein n=1 Tax=Yersinia alsatica TaxID=2890317 RepID=A0ABY5US09_9GAMM|nr:hypothetical protein [Yersinia alsatica]UWM44643.1 hypothetical protein N0H69_18610 [Yersinia alsatica]
MSKIERYAGNLRAFGSNAQGLERTLFGETTQADDLTSQVTSSFLRGWGIVGPSENPSMEDFNAAMYTMSQFIAYQHQMGIPEWDALQEYYSGSICVRNGEAYLSLVDSNIGSAPPSAKWTSVLTAKNALANISGFLKSSNNLSEIAAAGSPSVISALTNLKLTESTDGYVGRLVRVTTFPTSGTVTFNTNTKQVIFKIWGAGQGGGSAAAATSASGGDSGAGGGYTEVIANVKSLGLANVAITIGSGGSPAVLNSGTQGVAGGATVVGTLATAGGGSNGTGGSLTVNPLIGTIISVNGQNGQGGGLSGTGATGGAASWSFGGLPHAASVGDNGGFPGGGAAGGANISPSNNYIGGRGANGLVIVEEYA